MEKIISLFQRNYDGDRLVRDEIVPGAEWVVAGEGVATRKIDGTCCMIEDGVLWKRHTVKKGKKAPDGFRPATEVDPNTGKQEGWVRVGDGPEDARHREAFTQPHEDGTYELIGPKVQGNPERYSDHVLVRHGFHVFDGEDEPPRTFNDLKAWFETRDIEGIVWHHPDGRMVKIKKRDFGLPRVPEHWAI